ncbi:hypothetical protein K474DRAFT_1123117 [Panus rudis PR-1116 ss-1]|nr:hypothetical protein K474DRAFT_1123117 [Panus rudis PR-1116 ss-1]
MSSVSTPFHHLRVVTQYCIRDTTQDPLLLIEFLTHWAYRSSRVSRVLLDEGVFDLIERTLNMETPLEIDGYRCNERMSQDLRITQVLILLTALAHSFPDDTVRALSSSNVKAKLQRDLLVVRTQFNLRHDDARMSSTDVLPILQSTLFRSGCGLLESIPYSLRLIPGSGLAEDNDGALDSARELLKFCAIAPQESWVPTVLVESLYTNTGTLLNVMRYYSDVRQYPSTALSGARRRELLVFAHTSQAYGFDLINPLDRFVAFVVEAHTGAGAISERQLRFLYAEGGFVSLLDGLCAGDFDFVSEPTAEQRAKRSQNIEWLSTYMSLLSKYGDE